MPIYRCSIKGAEDVLVRAESAAKAKDQIVTVESLTGEEMADALEKGEKVHKSGEAIVFKPVVSAELSSLLGRSLSFVEGFEGDELHEGITGPGGLLTDLRAAVGHEPDKSEA